MVRKSLKEQGVGATTNFKLRGLENTRVESLSDGVFAIAIGLLLISSDFPKTFEALKVFMQDFIPFAGAITLLMLIWYQHYLFFIRYGLRDGKTVAVNTLLLFLVLFYVYPLKFLFKILYSIYSNIFTGNNEGMRELFTVTLPGEEAHKLMVIYGLGAAAVFLVLALLYFMALRKKEDLQLTPEEEAATRVSMNLNLVLSSVPILSSIIAGFYLFGTKTFIVSGFTYMLYMIIMPIYTVILKRREKSK